jgi:DNA repair protein RecN (Recombination protein N)
MLLSLKIRNLALVDFVEIDFQRGLNVLTGETGAGKSVVVSALSLVLGERADRDAIRHGEMQASVEALFGLENLPASMKKEWADLAPDGQVLIQREVLRDGNSRVRANGALIPLARLRELMSPMAEILGQHANQALLSESNHLSFLDKFAGVETLRDELASAYHEWERTREELQTKQNQIATASKDLELQILQRKEIEDANVVIGEEERLKNEQKVIESARQLLAISNGVAQQLDTGDQSILEQLRIARRELDKAAAIDDYLVGSSKQLAEAFYLLDDIRSSLEQYAAGLEDNPMRLDEIHQRLDDIYRLKKKYGGSEATILEHLAGLRRQLDDSPDNNKVIAYLSSEVIRCKKRYLDIALKLTDLRTKAAEYFQKLVIKELAALAIDSAQFFVEFIYEESTDGVEFKGKQIRPHPHGLESVRFLFSANAGEPLKSMVKTASGGELSRLLLAIKGAERKNNQISSGILVFDEIDSGIGGKTGAELGKRLAQLSENGQVLVITHLHQIARLADSHYVVKKVRGPEGRAIISVKQLDGFGVQQELERMLALPEPNRRSSARS